MSELTGQLHPHPEDAQRLVADLPSPLAPPGGCHFHPRCPHATDVCRIRYPAPADLGQGHRVRCHWPLVLR